MTTIRNFPVPTPTARRVQPAAKSRGSNDRPAQPGTALVPVPTPRKSEPRAKTAVRARNATSEVVVQVIAGMPARGLKAEASEIDRYRRAYAQTVAQTQTPRPKWERCA